MSWGYDTEYGGILYRSKCEAKWAEFFDRHSIRHRYEPERIDLGIDSYTPDFYLPDFDTWVEIKSWRQYRAHSKCYRLALETRKWVLLIQQYPREHIIDLFSPFARRPFVHRTVVAEGEVKPAKEGFIFPRHAVDEGKLILEHATTGEVISFPFERRSA